MRISNATLIGIAGLVVLGVWAQESYIRRFQNNGITSPGESIVNAASCSLLDVSNAVVIATNGQTVVIPAGDCTWDGPLNVGKRLKLRGAGTNSGATLTRITRSTGDIIVFVSETIGGGGPIGVYDMFLRFDNFQTAGDESAIKIDRPNTRAKLITDYRIARCKFEFGQRTLYLWGYGVVDHCTFVNANGDLHSRFDVGDDALDHMGEGEWDAGLRLGTTNSCVVEDCVFLSDAGASSRNQETLYGQFATRYIFRHNAVIQSGFNNAFPIIDAHGRTQTEDWRGSHVYEVYSNSFTWTATSTFRVCNLRGGTMLFSSNMWSGPIGATNGLIQLKDEGISTAGVVSTNDFLTNCFFFEMSFAGVTDESLMLSIENPPDSTPYVQSGVDYFFRAPQPGDVIYPYIKLQYPHPRVAREGL